MELLKKRIDKMFPTREAFAKELGVDPSALSRMLSSGNWKADRIEAAVRILKIPARDIPSYFFSSEVVNNTTDRKRETV